MVVDDTKLFYAPALAPCASIGGIVGVLLASKDPKAPNNNPWFLGVEGEGGSVMARYEESAFT